MQETNEVKQGAVKVLPNPRMRAALLLAIVADLAQMIAFPLFIEGAASRTMQRLS
jgi:hypothetical protein